MKNKTYMMVVASLNIQYTAKFTENDVILRKCGFIAV